MQNCIKNNNNLESDISTLKKEYVDLFLKGYFDLSKEDHMRLLNLQMKIQNIEFYLDRYNKD